MRIGALDIGEGLPCRLVAELSNNANGDYPRMLRLMDAAKEAGADLLKVQCYSVEELVALRGDGPAPAPWNNRSMTDLYRQAMTPREWFGPLFRYADSIGMPIFSSVFGAESLALLEGLNCPAYKIAALDRNAFWLQDAVKATGKPTLMSVREEYEDGWHSRQWYAALYCPPGYPTPPEEVALPDHFSESRLLGLSSHCLAPELPVAAVARGAKLLEYHFQLAEEPSELEANVSLNQYQWAAMVRSIRATEEMLAE